MKIDSIKQWFYENNSYINNSKDNILLNKLLYCSQYIIYNLIKSQHILKDNDYNNICYFIDNNINLSEKEMNDIVLTYNENNSYYIFKDNEGTTVIY